MFDDERINHESGEIYKKGIMLASLVALLYGVFRAVYLLVCDRFAISFTEIFIFLCGAVILIIDLILFRGEDERAVYNRHKFYLMAGKVFIVVSALGYAITIPLYTKRMIPDMPVNHLIIILEVLGYIFFFYNFKTRDINFNYTFISENNKTYYIRVLLNIGKLALALACVFSLSLVIDVLYHGTILSFISIVKGYFISVLGLGIEYLFVSVTEKVIYDEKDKDWLKKGTLIPAVALTTVTVFLAVTDLIYKYIIAKGLGSFDFDAIKLLGVLSRLQMYGGFIETVLIAMTLSFILSQISKDGLRKAIKGKLIISSASICWSFINSFLIYCFVYLIDYLADNDVLANQMIMYFTYVSAFIILIGAVINGIICYRFYKELNVSKAIMLVPIVTLIGYCVMIFMNFQSMPFAYSVVNSIISVCTVAIPLGVLSSKKNKNI